MIGPVFAARIVDWEPHLQRMCSFWSSVTLMTGRYHGQPMQKHLSLPVDVRHFDRWLALFEASSVMSADQKSSAKLIPSAVILGLLGKKEPLHLHALVCAFRFWIRRELGALCAFFGLDSILFGSRSHGVNSLRKARAGGCRYHAGSLDSGRCCATGGEIARLIS